MDSFVKIRDNLESQQLTFYNNIKDITKQKMGKFSLKYEASPQGLYLKYMQKSSTDTTVVILQLCHLSQTSIVSSQSGLVLDFNIRDTAQQQKLWSALQYRLRDVYESVVVGGMLPGCQLRVNIFVPMGQTEVEAAIINALFAGLVIMGIPMQYSVYAITHTDTTNPTTKPTSSNNTIILNTSTPTQPKPIYGKYTPNLHKISNQLLNQLQQYKQLLISTINQQIQTS